MDKPIQNGAKRVRVMVDATVLFAGIGRPRWSYQVLRHGLRGDFELVLSPLVIEQARRNLEKKLPEWVEAFEDWLRLCPFETVDDPSPEEVAANPHLMRQAEDVPVALSAIAARLDYFVSDDKDFTEESPTTAEIHKHLNIMRPVIFLREVMHWSRQELERVHFRDWPLDKVAE